MSAVVAWFLVAVGVGWLGVVVWLSARGALRWRLDVLASIGLVFLPLLAVYFAVRHELTVAGCALAAVAWIAFGALLWGVRRPRARRGGAGGGTQTPS